MRQQQRGKDGEDDDEEEDEDEDEDEDEEEEGEKSRSSATPPPSIMGIEMIHCAFHDEKLAKRLTAHWRRRSSRRRTARGARRRT